MNKTMLSKIKKKEFAFLSILIFAFLARAPFVAAQAWNTKTCGCHTWNYRVVAGAQLQVGCSSACCSSSVTYGLHNAPFAFTDFQCNEANEYSAFILVQDPGQWFHRDGIGRVCANSNDLVWLDARGPGCTISNLSLNGNTITWFSSCGGGWNSAPANCVCTPHAYSQCYQGDRWWYNSCNAREDLRQDCGDDSVDPWGSNYCKNNDLYHSRVVHDRGCNADACFDNTSTEEQIVDDCADNASDTDAQDVHTVGTCTEDNGCTVGSGVCNAATHTDVCFDADTVTEWRVSGGNCASTNINCPAGETCNGGKCGAANVPPSAVIDSPVGNQTITVGGSVSFAGHGVDSDGSVVAHSWSCVASSGVCPSGGSGFPRSVEDPGSITFATVGVYTVTYNVQDDDGAWDPTPATRIITVNPAANNPPNAVIDTPVGNQTVTVGQGVNFTGSDSDSDGVVVVRSWTCVASSGVCPSGGSGFPRSVQDPGSITFATVGVYTVTYNVQDDDGAWDPTPATRIITVNPAANNPPNAVIDTPVGNQTITVGQSVSFAGHGVDSDVGDVIQAHEWTCVVVSGGPCPSGASGFPALVEDPGNRVFGAVGQYTISYRVQDNHGAWDLSPDTRTITVNAPANNPPDSFIDSPADGASITVGGSFNFTGHGVDPDAGDILTYEWTCATSDGSCPAPPNGFPYNGQNPGSITFDADGGYTIRFRARDNHLLWDPFPASITVTVNPVGNNPPSAVIDSPASNQTITVGQSVSFAGHGEDSDVGDTIKTHEWTCIVLKGVGPCPSGFPSAAEDPGSRTFSVVGQYGISYTVQDNHDAWALSPATRTINVNPAVPSEPFLQITAFTADPLNFVAGETELKFNSVFVKVKNIGGTDVDAKVKLFLRDALTNATIVAFGEIAQPNIIAGSDAPFDFGVVDFSTRGIEPGTYKLVAEAFDQSTGELHDTESLPFSIIRPIPTPELSEFLLPLVACAVLAIVLFGRKRR